MSTFGWAPSMTATTEFVVPRSMPMILDIAVSFRGGIPPAPPDATPAPAAAPQLAPIRSQSPPPTPPSPPPPADLADPAPPVPPRSRRSTPAAGRISILPHPPEHPSSDSVLPTTHSRSEALPPRPQRPLIGHQVRMPQRRQPELRPHLVLLIQRSGE